MSAADDVCHPCVTGCSWDIHQGLLEYRAAELQPAARTHTRYPHMEPVMKKTLYAALAFGMTFTLAACNDSTSSNADALPTATPIKHLVVIYGENISFDHYFGTYPTAGNPPNEPKFTAAAGTPSANVLTNALLTNNGNLTNAANGTGVSNPFRLDRT